MSVENKGKVTAKGGKVVRHRKIIRDSIQGITKPGIKRICRRAGVLRIGGQVYEEFRGHMKVFMEDLLKNIITITEHHRRKTVTESDLESALQIVGIYLGAAENPNTNSTFSRVRSRTKSHKEETEPGKEVKPHKFKPGTVARRDIRHHQKHSDSFAFPKANVKRLTREIAQDYTDIDIRFTARFMELFQLVIETFLVKIMEAANLAALHAGRQSVYPKDLQLAFRVRRTINFAV